MTVVPSSVTDEFPMAEELVALGMVLVDSPEIPPAATQLHVERFDEGVAQLNNGVAVAGAVAGNCNPYFVKDALGGAISATEFEGVVGAVVCPSNET